MHFESLKTKGTNNYRNISEIGLSFVFTSTLKTDRNTPLYCIQYTVPTQGLYETETMNHWLVLHW